jgi:hypothetical protein
LRARLASANLPVLALILNRSGGRAPSAALERVAAGRAGINAEGQEPGAAGHRVAPVPIIHAPLLERAPTSRSALAGFADSWWLHA